MAWRPEDWPDFHGSYDPWRNPGMSAEEFVRAQRWYFAIYLPGLIANVDAAFEGVEVVWPDEEEQE